VACQEEEWAVERRRRGVTMRHRHVGRGRMTGVGRRKNGVVHSSYRATSDVIGDSIKKPIKTGQGSLTIMMHITIITCHPHISALFGFTQLKFSYF
jgi:hypothetical protein